MYYCFLCVWFNLVITFCALVVVIEVVIAVGTTLI